MQLSINCSIMWLKNLGASRFATCAASGIVSSVQPGYCGLPILHAFFDCPGLIMVSARHKQGRVKPQVFFPEACCNAVP